MASISSVASVFVLLLVAYCSSVPLPTDDEYTTGKSMVERDSMPMTFPLEHNTLSTKLDHKREFVGKTESDESREYTTGHAHVERDLIDQKESSESREYTTGLPHVEREFAQKKESDESREYTTGLPLVERELLEKKESSESREYTTGLPHVQREFVEKKESDESHEYTTGHAHVEREFVDKKESSESREYTTGLPHVEREFVEKKESDESREYTTGLPHVQREFVEKKESDESREYTTGLPHVERELLGKKESSESGEHTTERTLIKDGHKKRTIFGETTFAPFEATSVISKRSDDGEHTHVEGDSDEITTERTIVTGERDFDETITVAPEGEGEGEGNDDGSKRSVGVDTFDGLTTEYAITKDGHHKRTASITAEPFYFEATSMFNERALADESEEKTTERSHVPRTVDFDRFTTMESATDFNGRVEHKHEREMIDPEMTTFTTEHKPRAVAASHSMKLTKDVYMPVTGQKVVSKTAYSSVNAGSNNKVYPKTYYRN